MTKQLYCLGQIWTNVSDRSMATLGNKAVNDNKFFSKLANGQDCTTQTFVRAISFFRDAANWPDNVIPQGAAELLDNFENIASSADADPVECHGGDASVTSFDHDEGDSSAEDLASSGKSDDFTASGHEWPVQERAA